MTGQSSNLTDEQQVGVKMKTMRKSQKLTQEELAERISEQCSGKTISRYENGKGEMKLLTFFDICSALNCSPDSLVPDWLVPRKRMPEGYDRLNDENRAMIDKLIHALVLQQEALPA